ncbi:MAG: hypothetical protein US98_C0011G0005 [Parcubacteria group bacterium GW2011_GWC1_38_6]|nr:MAG: hypothetical protein US98_C0011G0005 [Parcubacteria group bacterium GW2011_GWC1_38_6]
MIAFLVYILALAVILALWEIQIEGKNGWAEKLPCWRIEKGWIVRVMGGRPFTGYHLSLNLFMMAVIHFPVLFVSWDWRLESLLLGSLIGIMVVEDFLWFIFNPHYGLKKFKKGEIWWHKNWWGPVPDFLLPALILACILIYSGRTSL